MEWRFETGGGVVTVRQEGERAVCQALRNAPGEGLYKAWISNGRNRVLLGALVPEGGSLRLRRNLPVAQLRGQGVWPPAGAEIVMTFPFSGSPPPAGFRWEETPWRFFSDPFLSSCVQPLGRCLFRKEPQGFSLALRFDPEKPFPLPPLFCLSRTETTGDENYLVFSFSTDGTPVLPRESSGENSGLSRNAPASAPP